MTVSLMHKDLTIRHPSGSIWGRIPRQKWSVGDGGIYFFDDFVNFSSHSADSDTTVYASYIDSGGTITQQAGTSTSDIGETGVVKFLTDATDEDEHSLQFGGGSGSAFAIDADDIYTLAFEVRFRTNTVTNDDIAFFMGLAEENLTATGSMDTSGVMADKDHIGFQLKNDDGNGLDFVYKKAGQTVQIIITGDANVTVDTWHKVGFLVSKDHPSSERIRIYYDNVLQTTFVTQTNLDAATFPDDEKMSPFAIMQAAGGASSTDYLLLDWWAIAAEI